MRAGCRLSIVHDGRRPKKLCPRRRLPFGGTILATTFLISTSPILKLRIRTCRDGSKEPSARMYVCRPRKSSAVSVFVRIKVPATSAGMHTSAAPLSKVKSRVSRPLMDVGRTNVPPSRRSTMVSRFEEAPSPLAICGSRSSSTLCPRPVISQILCC